MTTITQAQAKRIWIQAQRLDEPEPFGSGPEATRAAIEHLGYVQIDTISVIERCHHHILFSRIPGYRRRDLHQAQTCDKTVFEYWTHAHSYIPTRDFRFFITDMRDTERSPGRWYNSVKKSDLQKVLRLIKKQGSLSIRDIDDDVLVEKDHPWASRKPSKRALSLALYSGRLMISERVGMLKKYELTTRHFGWDRRPPAASKKEVTRYLLDRALRAQGLVSLDSVCHLCPSEKPSVEAVIEKRVRSGELVEIHVQGAGALSHWIRPEKLETTKSTEKNSPELTHILSPFDPLVIQRKRLQLFFEYEHRFEAYLPKEKRKFGYFVLPVLVDDQIVAAIDLKTDRANHKLLLQRWTWIAKHQSPAHKHRIEKALGRFEKFQLEK